MTETDLDKKIAAAIDTAEERVRDLRELGDIREAEKLSRSIASLRRQINRSKRKR